MAREFTQELERIQNEPDIHALLVDMVGDPTEIKPTDGSYHFSDPMNGFGALLILPSMLLYRWAIDTLSHRRNKNEIDEAQQQVRIINSLVEGGMPSEAAVKLTLALMAAIAKRNKDDSGLMKILSIAAKVLPAIIAADPTNSKLE